MNADADFVYDFFISYSDKDVKWVRNWLVPELERMGIAVCVNYKDFELGAPVINEMERAVRTSCKIILILSTHYVEREWTEFESVLAQSIDPAAREHRVIPLVLENVEIPIRLSKITCLNFSDPETRAQQLQRLIQSTKLNRIANTKPKILLVENESSWIKITKAILADYDVEEVRTSADAISRLESDTCYDLVITNLNLTEVDEASGQEILEYIRDHRPSLPRIVNTGKPVRGPIYSTLFEGYQITDFITKDDINVPELRQLVRRILSPTVTGTRELQSQKDELLRQLKVSYDELIGNLNEGIKALDSYKTRLRREVGQNQAEELTRPDKNVLLKKRQEYKQKFDNLVSSILTASDSRELKEIDEVFRNEW